MNGSRGLWQLWREIFNSPCRSNTLLPVGSATKKEKPTAVAARQPCRQQMLDLPLSEINEKSVLASQPNTANYYKTLLQTLLDGMSCYFKTWAVNMTRYFKHSSQYHMFFNNTTYIVIWNTTVSSMKHDILFNTVYDMLFKHFQSIWHVTSKKKKPSQ